MSASPKHLHRPITCVLIFASALLVNADTAHAESKSETHDGFLLRFSLGLGYEGLGTSDGAGTQIDVSGFGLSSSLSLGGVVAQSLALHGDFFGLAAFSPNVALNGEDLGEAGDSSISLSGFGAGLTYWVMPLNLYISGTLALAQATIDIEGNTTDSDWGFAVRAMVGKEWWVASEWGIGLMAEITWANIPVEVDDGSASFVGINFGLSVTYN